ncbi:MAG: M50 family metallopeptidase, partial [Acidobacteria bacterium]|nr:M50 family metallopeptidase [Acidobacteriota bacterium]
GIPVKIDLSFLVIGALLASSRLSAPIFLIEWVVVIFISILVHEFGHAFACRAFGLSPQIQLYAMGGLTSWNDDRRVSPQQNIAISLAGPFAGFLFGGLVFLLGTFFPDAQASPFNRQVYLDLLFVNWGWGIFNLLPVLPLDGGHVVGSIEEWVTKKTGGLISRTLSLAVAASLAIWAFSASWYMVAILMGLFAWINGSALYQQIQSYRDRRLRSPLEQAQESFKKRDGAAVVRQAQEILQSAGSDSVKYEAQRLMVQGLILENDLEEAKKELIRLQAVYGPKAAQQALMGFEPEEWPRALPLIEHAYQTSQMRELGMMLAYALILAQRFQEAMPLIADPSLAEYATGLYALMQATAFQAGEYDISAEAGMLAIERGGGPHLAYNVGCAHARAGRTDQALEWVNRAVAGGYSEGETLASDPDLDVLRGRPEFEMILSRLRESKA